MKRILAAAVVSFLFGACAPKSPSHFDVRFGILANQNGKQSLRTETNIVPFITKDKGQLLGAVITPAGDGPYRFYTVIYLPKQPTRLSGDIAGSAPTEAVEGVRSPERGGSGEAIVEMWFDEGDPLGKYKVELFINDALFKTIEFEAVAP